MKYATPAMSRLDLKVEHCMCCSFDIKDLSCIGPGTPQPAPFTPIA